MLVGILDDGGMVKVNEWLGNIVVVDAVTSPDAPYDSNAVRQATESVWTLAYASLSRSVLFEGIPKNATNLLPGTLSMPVTRLYVAGPVAWTVVAYTVIVLACTAIMTWFAETTPSILREEPKGLLGSAVLLNGSTAVEFVDRISRENPQANGRLQTEIGDWYDIDKAATWFDPGERKICLQEPERRTMAHQKRTTRMTQWIRRQLGRKQENQAVQLSHLGDRTSLQTTTAAAPVEVTLTPSLEGNPSDNNTSRVRP